MSRVLNEGVKDILVLLRDYGHDLHSSECIRAHKKLTKGFNEYIKNKNNREPFTEALNCAKDAITGIADEVPDTDFNTILKLIETMKIGIIF